jgi:hypothetical protein
MPACRVAAGRGFYAGLRWGQAVTIDLFAECRVPHDQTPGSGQARPLLVSFCPCRLIV